MLCGMPGRCLAWRDVAWYGVIWHGMTLRGVVWCGVVLCGMVRRGVAWRSCGCGVVGRGGVGWVGDYEGARDAYGHHTHRWSNWAHAHSGEACGGQLECGGQWAAKPVKPSPAPTSTTPVRQLLGSTNAETTPQGTQAAAAVRKH